MMFLFCVSLIFLFILQFSPAICQQPSGSTPQNVPVTTTPVESGYTENSGSSLNPGPTTGFSPCTSFYDYVCQPIGYKDVTEEIEQKNIDRIKKGIKEINDQSPKPFRKLKQFYDTCQNVGIEKLPNKQLRIVQPIPPSDSNQKIVLKLVNDLKNATKLPFPIIEPDVHIENITEEHMAIVFGKLSGSAYLNLLTEVVYDLDKMQMRLDSPYSYYDETYAFKVVLNTLQIERNIENFYAIYKPDRKQDVHSILSKNNIINIAKFEMLFRYYTIKTWNESSVNYVDNSVEIPYYTIDELGQQFPCIKWSTFFTYVFENGPENVVQILTKTSGYRFYVSTSFNDLCALYKTKITSDPKLFLNWAYSKLLQAFWRYIPNVQQTRKVRSIDASTPSGPNRNKTTIQGLSIQQSLGNSNNALPTADDSDYVLDTGITGHPNFGLRTETDDLSDKCLKILVNYLPFNNLIAKILSDSIFPFESDKKIVIENLEIFVDVIKNTIQDLVHRISWLSKESKKTYKMRFEEMKHLFLHPWYVADGPVLDEYYSPLEIENGNNMLDILYGMKKFGVYVKALYIDKENKFANSSFSATFHTPTVYYEPQNNRLVIPSGVVQVPFYDGTQENQITNYAGIGFMIARAIMDSFDENVLKLVMPKLADTAIQQIDKMEKCLKTVYENFVCSKMSKPDCFLGFDEIDKDVSGLSIIWRNLFDYLTRHQRSTDYINHQQKALLETIVKYTVCQKVLTPFMC